MAERRVSTAQAAKRIRASTVKPLTVKQRGEKAMQSLRQVLELPVVTGDASAFGAALAEIASEESAQNARFADALHTRYRELLALQPAPKAGSSGPKQDLPPLIPIRRIDGYRADPFSPPDPHFLVQLYGSHQLDRALQDYTLDMLKETAAKMQAAHPGTRPHSKASKQSVIDYIVQYSATSD